MHWEVFTQMSTFQVQIHWLAAASSFLLGVTIFARRKGTRSHRFLGRAFVAAMVITAVSAFFVRGYGNQKPWSWFDGFSWIHLLIPVTLYSLVSALVAIRRGNVRKHKQDMILTFAGALLIAGAFTFLPGRHMHTLFFGDPVSIQEKIDKNIKH